MKAKGIIILILILIALILIIQNAGVVPIQLFFWQIWLSKIVLIVIMLGIGFGIGFVLAKLTGKKGAKTEKT